ncbi:MAG: quinol:cytochrome C oxidoreductase, partial [Candidatus Sericytochromatia bacterium]
LMPGIIGDHYYSIGFGMFAGNVFWTYTAFSQCMLIWYANQPEETPWFIHRWENGWWVISIALVIIHFIIPFFALIQRKNKRNPSRMLFCAGLYIFAHCFDLYWIVMPIRDQLHGDGGHQALGPSLSLAEPAVALVAAGFIMFWFQLQAKKRNLVAIGDPKLQRGLNFRL